MPASPKIVPESHRIYLRLLRGEATSCQYVAALRAEARARVLALRGGGS